MANRNFNRMQALDKEVKVLTAEVSIGASGAPTLRDKTIGIESVERDAAGEYTITLQDKYVRLLDVSVSHEAAAAEDITIQVKAQDVQVAKTIEIFTKAAAVATDPSDGSVLRVVVVVKNSGVGE